MANKPLKSIKFPGLADTYTVPQVDDTLAITGAAADAKAVGDAIEAIEPGLSSEAKTALLNCFAHVAWVDEHGQNYYDALESALYSNTYPKIKATYNPAVIIYTDDTLATIKQYLTVKYYETKDDAGTVIAASNYTLTGTLTVGECTLLVEYGDLRTYVTVDVTNAIMYRLSAPITVDGSSGYLETDVTPFTEQKSFAILVTALEDNIDFSGSAPSAYTIVSASSPGSTSMMLATYKPTNASNVITRMSLFGKTYVTRELKENCGNRLIRYAASYDANTQMCTCFISKNGSIFSPYTDGFADPIPFVESADDIVRIGCTDPTKELYKGTISDVVIYNHTLTTAQLRAYVTGN